MRNSEKRLGQSLAPSEVPQVPADAFQTHAEVPKASAIVHARRREEARVPIVTIGVLRAAQAHEEAKWRCKVPSCTISFHSLPDCAVLG
jgi:hypothetical protein